MAEDYDKEEKGWLDEVPKGLAELTRRAQLGYHGEEIKGAVCILQFEKSSTTHILGSMSETEVFGTCIAAILQTFAYGKEKEALELAKGFQAMMEKTQEEEH